MELLKKDWEHVKNVSKENLRGAILGQRMAEIGLKLAEEELAKFPEEAQENNSVN